MFGANPIQHWVPLSIFSSMVVAASCYGYACNCCKERVFQDKKINGMEQSTGNIIEENLIQSAFHQTLGDEFTFQQDNNLKHKDKSTRVAYQEDSECSWVGE